MDKVITENNIAEVLASAGLVVVDFWAPWCGPCRMLGPTVEEIANEYVGRAVVAKCNVDDCEEISFKYGIRNIPSILFFKNGELVDRTAGLVSKAELAAKIDSLL